MEKLVIIRNLQSDFVLDGIEGGRVRTTTYQNLPSQQWYMAATGDGSYTFQNRASGQVLAVLDPRDVHTTVHKNLKENYWLVNNDQTIQNVAKKLVLDNLDFYHVPFQSDSKVIVYAKHGRKNQRFALQQI